MISASTRIHGVFWSEDIFEEWRRVAPREGLTSLENVVRFQTIMNAMFQDALIHREKYERLIDQMTNDEGDRHVLAAAVSQGEVGVIVTHNLRHFPPDAIDPFDLEVQTPDEFVRNQAELNPRNFIQVFLRRAERRNELALNSGRNQISPHDIANFLRDGPANMVETGNYILELLG
ncbi:MAG: hypothetical protein IPG59_01710 [Candidatus Melainabacteria bacterium]|nr:MAG: hypothetical protein IPG59_01710 [Candidatus Melainabacteria bacterium]